MWRSTFKVGAVLLSPLASIFRAAKAFRITWSKRKCASNTSPKWIDREGLGKRHTGFVQGLGKARCSIAPLQKLCQNHAKTPKPRQNHANQIVNSKPIRYDTFSCNPRIIWNIVYVDRVLPFTSVLKIRVFYFFSALCFHGSWIQDHSLLWKESRI